SSAGAYFNMRQYVGTSGGVVGPGAGMGAPVPAPGGAAGVFGGGGGGGGRETPPPPPVFMGRCIGLAVSE
ncbi:hypothetical protein NKW44_12215, partial [Acetobacter lovaniensis]|uniref:hypothetical protein n=1 Tax=Acetobacter lovaniensis TaxID=104100 RepID=UPI0020A22AA0